MASLNKVMLIGNAGKDADLRYTANGVATATFSLAVNGRQKSAGGEWQDHTEWFNVVLFAETAERLSQYITKGKPLYVEGRQQTRSWTNDDGMKNYRTEVIAQTIQLLGSRDDAQGGAPNVERTERKASPRGSGYDRSGQAARAAYGASGDDIDDLPFE